MEIIKFLNKLRIFPYIISGIFFTIFGPFIFWNFYHLGPLLSVICTDLLIHILRFNSFKYFVFKKIKGYKVTVFLYLKTVIPITLVRISLSLISYDFIKKEYLIILITLVTIFLGFIFSQINFRIKKTNI